MRPVCYELVRIGENSGQVQIEKLPVDKPLDKNQLTTNDCYIIDCVVWPTILVKCSL